MKQIALSSQEDQALRDNLAILQKQTQFKVPNIDVPVQVDLPELNAPAGRVGDASALLNKVGGANIPIPPTSRIGQAVVRAALQMRGIPYSWGGGGAGGPSKGIAQGANTVGFDCSGLVQYAFAKYGVSIPRVTYDQFRAGTPVPTNAMRPGDLVFFHPGANGPGHVGIFIGNGKFLQAPQTGDVVKISNLADRTDLVGVRRFG
jgi:cell wall-associated NlpC family hydrolase